MNFLQSFFKKINIFKGKTVYEKYTLGGTTISAKEKKLIHDNQKLLMANQVPINKVRFVFHQQFTYDIDKNIINPVYYAFFPMNGNNGKFIKDEPVIELGKPDKLITVVVGSYQTADNYVYLKETLKRCKRGVAIMIADEIISTVSGPEVYKFSVADEVIHFAVLDDAVEHYNAVV
jgi:hypothetical protein